MASTANPGVPKRKSLIDEWIYGGAQGGGGGGAPNVIRGPVTGGMINGKFVPIEDLKKRYPSLVPPSSPSTSYEFSKKNGRIAMDMKKA